LGIIKFKIKAFKFWNYFRKWVYFCKTKRRKTLH